MGEYFVLNDGGVIVDKDSLDRESRDVGDHDSPEGVGDRGVNANEGERCLIWVILVKFDAEPSPEGLNVPAVVLSRIVPRVIGRRYMGDGLILDADDLDSRLC
jgi:hypothetical protein